MLHGTDAVMAVSQAIPLGHRAAPRLPPTWGSAGGDCLTTGSCVTNMGLNKSTGKKWRRL
jgi:hypothetical protein